MFFHIFWHQTSEARYRDGGHRPGFVFAARHLDWWGHWPLQVNWKHVAMLATLHMRVCIYIYTHISRGGWIRDPCLWVRGVHNSKIVCAQPYRPVAFPRVKKFLGAEKVLPGKVLCWAREALLKYQLWICRSGWWGKNARSSWLLLQKLCFRNYAWATMFRQPCFGNYASAAMLLKPCFSAPESKKGKLCFGNLQPKTNLAQIQREN